MTDSVPCTDVPTQKRIIEQLAREFELADALKQLDYIRHVIEKHAIEHSNKAIAMQREQAARM